jgi:hypothetical protein
MDEFFASKPTTNENYLCVGPLTRGDAAEAADNGIGNGLGYYIYVAPASGSEGALEILGKLAGEDAARRLCDLLGLQTYAVAA